MYCLASIQQATLASIKPNPINQYTSTVDHQHHSMYHRSVMSNPRHIAPVPAQQMLGDSAVEISSSQRTSQQHSSVQHGFKQRQQPASTFTEMPDPLWIGHLYQYFEETCENVTTNFQVHL